MTRMKGTHNKYPYELDVLEEEHHHPSEEPANW